MDFQKLILREGLTIMFFVSKEGTLNGFIFNSYNFHEEIKNIPQNLKNNYEQLRTLISTKAKMRRLVARPRQDDPWTFNLEPLCSSLRRDRE